MKALGNYSAPNNQHRQTQLMRCRVARSRKLTSSNFGNRYRFSFWRKLLVGMPLVPKISIMRAILDS